MTQFKVFRSTVVSLAAIASMFVPTPAQAQSRANEKPLIGINLDLEGTDHLVNNISVLYPNAIKKAGGIPVLLTQMSAEDLNELLPKLDGVVMIGGADYPPSMYGKETHPSVSLMEKDRSDFDFALTKAALAVPDMPILGICAGCQILNIEPGGSLIQDIPSHQPNSKIMHASPDGWKKGFHRHEVQFKKDSKLGKLYPAPISVPTSHHQCIENVASGFRVVATSSDGLPEAIEKTGDRFVVGVQFHPERDYEANKALFAELIRNAKERQEHRQKLAEAQTLGASR